MFIVEINKDNAISYMIDGEDITRIEVHVDDNGIHENTTKSNEDWMLNEIYNSEKVSCFSTDSLKKIPMDFNDFVILILNKEEEEKEW